MTQAESVISTRQPGILWPTVITITTLFLGGMAAGYFDAHTPQTAAIASGSVLIVGIGVLAAYLCRYGRFWQSWTQRKRLYTVSLLLAGVLGLVSAITLRLGVDDLATTNPYGGGGPFDPRIAVGMAAIWLIGMGLVVLLYHRTVDDHEKQAYLWAGLAGYYAMVFVTPVWWLLARANLVPPVDAMALFLFVIIVNGIVYLWLKYR